MNLFANLAVVSGHGGSIGRDIVRDVRSGTLREVMHISRVFDAVVEDSGLLSFCDSVRTGNEILSLQLGWRLEQT